MRVSHFFNFVEFCLKFSFCKLKRFSIGRSYGRITALHRNSGSEFYKSFSIDNKKLVFNNFGYVVNIIKRRLKPSLAVINYEAGFIGTILRPKGLKLYSLVTSDNFKPLPCLTGYTMPLKFIPIGKLVHNIGFSVRSAGTSAQVLRQYKGLTSLKLPSGKTYLFSDILLASIGQLDNAKRHLIKLKKAGDSFVSGRRPHVRGTAMNPIDHPHGGGQGKTSGGRPSVSRTAVLAKGYKTKKRKTLKRNQFQDNNNND